MHNTKQKHYENHAEKALYFSTSVLKLQMLQQIVYTLFLQLFHEKPRFG